MQYFASVDCPDDVTIPTDDETAWALFPHHRWVYDKLRVADSQGLPAAPHGVPPPTFPVFSKPVYNLHGMGAGGRALHSPADLAAHETPGHFWTALLQGEHLSTDVAVVDGVPAWWRHTVGAPLAGGCFDRWTVLAEPLPILELACGGWLRRHLVGYTGAVNLETIGGRIIEVHLRFADQWPDLYGAGWLDAIVGLYRDGRWEYADDDRRTGYSVVLFGPHGRRYGRPPDTVLDVWRRAPGISSVQITFHPDLPPERHAMPPGGFRLAVVNCWNLDAGRAVRDALAVGFEVTPPRTVPDRHGLHAFSPAPRRMRA